GLYSGPRPGNTLVIGEDGDIAIYFTNEDGDMEAIFFVNRKSGAEPEAIKQFGQDPHQYGGGGGGSGAGSGRGSGGGGGGFGGGSSNCGPKGARNGVLGGVQTVLDVVGLVPGFGEIADGINAVIYAANGDYVNASLSLAAMIPIGGQLATAGKLGMKAAD